VSASNGKFRLLDFAQHFSLAKPTLSGHFAVLKEADLIQADKVGTTITYHLNLSVLEESLFTLINTFGISLSPKEASVRDSKITLHRQ
jgi:ArsR family transcriptional regulator, arsenate/arsenite/antimonite-responsive transcriptional repressor